MSRQSTPDIMCWQHCDKLTNILCFSVPPVCPLCHYNTTHSPSRIPPYKLPSPLTNAGESPVSLVVRPTVGTFLRYVDNFLFKRYKKKLKENLQSCITDYYHLCQGSKVFWSTPIPTNQWQISLPTLIKTSLPIPWCMGIRVDQKSLASEGDIFPVTS